MPTSSVPVLIRQATPVEKGAVPASSSAGAGKLLFDESNRGLWWNLGFPGSATGLPRVWYSVGSQPQVQDTTLAAASRAQELAHILDPGAGLPAAGFGVFQEWRGLSTDGLTAAPQNYGRVTVGATDVTTASVDTVYELALQVASVLTTMARVQEPTADTEVGLFLRVNDAGVVSLLQVTRGADNSGGAGFALLRVPN